MKKVLLVTVIVILGLTNINAQEVEFGVKGGLSLAYISGEYTDGQENVNAFNFGLIAEIQFNEKFYFQPELIYSGQGYSFNDNTTTLNYLNIPLVGKYYLIKGLSLEAGPQLGFLLSAKKDNTDLINSFQPIDFGLNFGLGYKLENGLNFGVRYNLGLTDINDIGFRAKNENRVLQLSVGYFFF